MKTKYTRLDISPEVTELVEALEEMISVAERVDSWESFPSDPIERAEKAISNYLAQPSSALEEKIKEVANNVRLQVSELLFDVESDVLPYIVEDTEMNASIQAQDIVENILSGNFIFDGDYIVVNNVREFAPRVRFAFTSLDYDNLRDKIIERMPKCPKDAKIAALEYQLKQSYDRY